MKKLKRTVVDLDDSILEKVDELAKKEYRKRKPMIEVIIKRYFQ